MKSKYSLLLILAAVSAFGQTVLSPMPRQCFNDTLSAGKPLAGGKIFTYKAGTSVQSATFTDSTGLVSNTNPIILDSAGCAGIWLTSGQAYRFVARSSAGVQEWTTDNVSGLATTSAAFAQAITTVAYSATPTFTATGQYQVFKITLTGNVTSSTLDMSAVTVPSLVTFEISQDAGGGRTFVWPLSVSGATELNSRPVSTSAQTFVWDGNTAFAVNSPDLQSLIPVELFGAVGDWNGVNGTDDTSSIQACLNALIAGQCQLQAKAYKITRALTINKSGIGLVGTQPGSPSPGAYPLPSPSQIVSTCATCDIVDVAGTNATTAISFNTFRNVTLSRSVTPGGGAKGLSLSFADSPIIDGVTSQDSISDFYFHGVNATSASQRIQNSFAVWGVNGVAESTGSLYGFQVDSADGSTNNSLYLQNTGVVSNFTHNGTSTTYGYYSNGSKTHDLFCSQCNASSVDYGIYISSTSSAFTASTDIHFNDSKMDGCTISCVFTNSLTGTMSITGGWFYLQGGPATPVMEFENSANISVVNATLYFPSGTGGGILAHTGNSIQTVGNKFSGLSSGTAITYSGILNGIISGNDAGGITATSIISLITSGYIAVSSNTLSGIATNGILIDSASTPISGLETNVCGGSGGTVTTCINDSAANISQFVSGWLLKPIAVGSLPTCNAALEGAARAVNNANSATFNAAVAAGGGNHVIAYCNGTGWVIH